MQKLRDKTPHCVVMFLGGSLPGKALLHLRLLSNFGMICRLQGSFLHKIAVHQLTSAKPSSGSWFLFIRELCLKYELPAPLDLLHCPLPKTRYKALIKSKVVDFWEKKLRTDPLSLSSLATNMRDPIRQLKRNMHTEHLPLS